MATPQTKGEKNAASLPSQDAQNRKVRDEKLRAQLDVERASFLSHWKELNDYILPRRGRFQITDVNKGDRRTKAIIDATATIAARTLSSGMMSGITSPARPWFRLTTPDASLSEVAAVKEWLGEVTDRMETVMLRSNVYNALPTIYQDMGVFGTAAMAVMEDDESVIRCYPVPIGSYLIANDHKLRVRVFIRELTMTVRQIVEQFTTPGKDGQPQDWSNVSSTVRTNYENGVTELAVGVVHVVAPNPQFNPAKIHGKFKRFRSCYYERGASNRSGSDLTGNDPQVYLAEEGFDEFPFLVPRWEVTGQDAYATNSPGMTALGDIKQLQTVEKRLLQALEKQVNPPLAAPSSLRATVISQIPGEISYYDDPSGQMVKPLVEISVPYQEIEQKQAQVRERIRRIFFEDLFLMLAYSDDQRSTQPVTAREIEERHEEKLLALGPVLEQLNQDLLDPLIDRVFAIMVRKGLIPDPPQELAGQPLKVEYLSVMAQAQKMVGLSGIERLVSFVGSIVQQTQDTSVLDKIDFDQTIDEYAEMTGVPPHVIVPDDKVQQIRDQRAQVAAQQHAAAMTQAAASTAQTLSQTDTSGKNALSDLVQGAQPNPASGQPVPGQGVAH